MRTKEQLQAYKRQWHLDNYVPRPKFNKNSHTIEYKRAWNKAHSVSLAISKKKYAHNNHEKVLDSKRRYREKNRERLNAVSRLWKRQNPQLSNYYTVLRRKYVKERTPYWCNKRAIKEIYKNCPKGYDVDHIVPLRGKNVSGLHVAWNLQYLPRKENQIKSNKLLPQREMEKE